MKKYILSFVLIMAMALSLYGCGKKEQSEPDHTPDTETENSQENEFEEEQEAEPADTLQAEDSTFSFADLKNLEFWFSSGAGGWATIMTIDEDGSFSGEFFDGDLGVTGEGYPNGTMYQSNFTGQFTQPEKVNEYTYAMQIQELTYAEEVGKEEIKDGMLYVYTDVYGLEESEDILVYLPGAPLAELPEEFRSWIGYYDLSRTEETELPFYAINNEAKQEGFSGYNIIDGLKDTIAYTETQSDALNDEIETGLLTQTELNEKTHELYELWDYALNATWDVLKRTKDAKTMEALIIDEREWIARKDEEVKKAGEEFEGGTMQPMIMDNQAMVITKDRVYELLELLEQD